jgi:hypothetical protein
MGTKKSIENEVLNFLKLGRKAWQPTRQPLLFVIIKI